MPPMQPNGMPPMQPNGMPPAGSKEQNKKKDKKNKKKKSTGKKVALIAIPVVIVAALGVGAAIYVPKYLNYDKANTALNNGEIDKAIELYNKCGSYKDSQTMINGGAYYTYAENLAASGDLISAAENYHKAAGLSYEGASEKELECYYNQAEKLYGEGNYTEAADYYKKASGYNDADVKVKECAYENANVLMASGDYAGAVEAFTLASDYEDSADKIKECYYNEALAKMEAGEYEEASEEFLKSEYSDYMIQANDCIYQLAAAYVNDGKYEEALDTYEKVDSEYKDCSKDIATCQEKWGDSLVDSKDYTTAIEKYSLIADKDMSDKINKAKAAYIKDHYDSSDEQTVSYLCDLRYENYGSAEEDYTKLIGWNVSSFVNSSETDYETQKNSIKAKDTIYVHTMFTNENNDTLNLYGYIVYSDGTRSNDVTFGTIENDYTTWISVEGANAIVGDAVMYIYTGDTGKLIEKYPFKIKKA
jgi:tetratricopeptide (TPR) repeat protein